MKRVLIPLLIALSLCQSYVIGQITPSTPPLILIKAGKLINVRTGRIEENLGITRAGDRSTQWMAHEHSQTTPGTCGGQPMESGIPLCAL